jgi:glycosyltransferase involved in cell wall biosynthesis
MRKEQLPSVTIRPVGVETAARADDTNGGPPSRHAYDMSQSARTDIASSARGAAPGQPLVSVVTPLYNCEAYLAECIDSVLGQSYQNWDYTIVNNCSTDRSLEIASEYAARDARIRIHNNRDFVRVIENHNIAFRQISADSKYCKVVAADDWLFPECLERMVQVAEENPSVAIVGAYGLVGRNVAYDGLPYPSTVVSGREICRDNLLNGRYLFGAATTLLYTSSSIRSRPSFYNESNLHADKEVCFELLQSLDFGFVHQVLTFSRVRDESLSEMSWGNGLQYPSTLYDLTRYGPAFLTREELEARIDAELKVYYNFLATSLYDRRGAEFWKLHADKLAALGMPLSETRVAWRAFCKALDAIGNPKRTGEGVARRLRGLLESRRKR